MDFASLDRDGCSSLRNSIEHFYLIKPFAIFEALLEVEACRREIAGRPASRGSTRRAFIKLIAIMRT